MKVELIIIFKLNMNVLSCLLIYKNENKNKIKYLVNIIKEALFLATFNVHKPNVETNTNYSET